MTTGMIMVIAALISIDCRPYLIYGKCLETQSACVEHVISLKSVIDSEYALLEEPLKLAIAYNYCKKHTLKLLNGDFDYSDLKADSGSSER